MRRFVGTLVSCKELPVRRIEVEAGQEMQIEYGQGARYMDHTGKLRKTYIFRRVLSHSRKGDTEVVTRLTTESLIRSLENAFGALINRTIEKTLVAVVDAYGVAAVIGWRIGSWIAPIVVKTGSLIDDGASAFQSLSEFTQGHRGTEGFHLDGSISVSW